MSNYYSCRLTQDGHYTTAYVREDKAHLGAIVELEDQKPEGYWRILSVGPRLTDTRLKEAR